MTMRQEIIKTDAFRNVSFDPEKRIERFANDFESGVREIEEKCKKYGVDHSRMVEKYFKLAMDYLHSESRYNSNARQMLKTALNPLYC